MTTFSTTKQCALAAVLCAPLAVRAAQTGYSMPAVCDYIAARLHGATALVMDTPGLAALETNVRDTAIYRQVRDGETVRFYRSDGQPRVIFVQQFGRVVPDESKRALLLRLGVKPAHVGDTFEAGCDLSSLTLHFRQGKLAEVLVETQLD